MVTSAACTGRRGAHLAREVGPSPYPVNKRSGARSHRGGQVVAVKPSAITRLDIGCLKDRPNSQIASELR